MIPRFNFLFRGTPALGCFIALLYLASAYMALPVFSGGFTPDTAEYLEFSPYRQPLYGAWAHGVFGLAGSWKSVQYVQVALFLGIGMWLIYELSLLGWRGVVSAFFFAAILGVANFLGLLSIVASIVSEGLFYSLILLGAVLLLFWQRLRHPIILTLIGIVVIAQSQVRPAALLVPIIPAVIVLLTTVRRPKQPSSFLLVPLMGGLFLGSALIPPLCGKQPFQLVTKRDGIGMFLLPRLALVPMPPALAAKSPDWATMAASWREAANGLSPIALSQFDAQLTETIRFELAPNVLLPDLLGISPESARVGWVDGTTYPEARRLAFEWIRQDWPAYARQSAYHYWGTLTMANFMGNEDRAKVWSALQQVSKRTWRIAPMRTDYPLNRIDVPLKWKTALLYWLIRSGSILALIFGLVFMVRLTRNFVRGELVASGQMVLSLAVAWCLLHSVSVALLNFPEYRYTYANLLCLAAGATAWFAHSDRKGPCR